ncbi:MAG: PL29 family lyase N-terminal domain-containing protein, partial [Candidatus Cryptobacteroides sp.]
MKRIFCLSAAILFLFAGCSEVNVPEELLNGDLIGRLDDLESRVDDLEQQCKKINSDIAALQAIVNAVQTRDYITAVEPVVENGVEVGCRIVFANADPIVIYHGKDGTDGKDGEDGKDGADGENGQDGVAPVIGIAQDSDSVWYWTLNGDWLLDDAGNKIKAVGVDGADGNDGTDGLDGKDGVTPTLQITEGYWEISYDNGVTWTRLGKAVGEDGKDGQDGVGNCIISKVYEDNGYVVFLLSTGEEYKVPFSANSLDIIFSVEPGFGLMQGKTTVIDYTIVGGDENTLVRLIPGEVLECVVKAKSNTEGSIYIKVWTDEDGWDKIINPDVYGDATYGDMIEAMYALLVSVSDGKGNTLLKSLNFARGVLESICDAYLVDATAGLITTTVKANTTYDEVVYDASWLSFVETKAMWEDKLTFSYEANESDRYRCAFVDLKNTLGQTLESFAIVQRTATLSGNIEFADLKVKEICVQRYDKDGDGELSYDEASLVTDVNGLFDGVTQSITSFDEFQYFSSVRVVPDYFLCDDSALRSITLPNSIDSLGERSFYNCILLERIVVPEGVTTIPECCFYGCSLLKEVQLPATLNAINNYAFSDCTSLESITIPE